MMKTNDITIDARCALAELGVPQNILDRLTATRDEDARSNGEFHSTLTMHYTVHKNGFDRQKDVAISNMSNERFDDMLNDRQKMATFLQMGMNATPVEKRIELPGWVTQLSQAAKREADMARARNIAKSAVSK